MPRRSKSTPPQMVGVIGTGEVSARKLKTTLNDYAFLDGVEYTFVFVVTDKHFTDAQGEVMNWVEKDEDMSIATVTTSEDKKAMAEDLKGTEVTTASNPIAKFIEIVTEDPENTELFVLWNDDDTDMHKVCAAADKEKIVVRDLTEALEKISFGDDEEGDDAGADDGDEEAAVADDEPEAEPEPTFYTQKKLEGMERPQLVEVADDWGVEIPPRSRANSIIKLILEAQDEYRDKQEAKSAPEVEDATEDGELVEGQLLVADNSSLVEEILEGVAGLLSEFVVSLSAALGADAKSSASSDDDSDDDADDDADEAPRRRRRR